MVKASDFDSDMRGFESFLPCQIFRLTLRTDARAALHGSVDPCCSTPCCSPATPTRRWPQEIATHLGIAAGQGACVGRFSDGEVTVEIKQNVRARDVFVVQSDLRADQREPDGAADHGRRAQARLGPSASPP